MHALSTPALRLEGALDAAALEAVTDILKRAIEVKRAEIGSAPQSSAVSMPSARGELAAPTSTKVQRAVGPPAAPVAPAAAGTSAASSWWPAAALGSAPVAQQPQQAQASVRATSERERRRRWQHWQTPAEEHNKEPVLRVIHVPGLPNVLESRLGLLISVSRQVLNLWSCEDSCLSQLMSVQVDHSIRAVDHLLSANQLLVSSKSADKEFLCTYSLNGESLFERRLKLPAPGAVSSVASLQAVGFGFAAAQKQSISIFDLAGSAATLRGSFEGHAAPVSCMQQGAGRALGLISGGHDGIVHVWDLQRPPREPALRLQAHTRPVTSVATAGEHLVLTSGADGHLCAWDVRRAAAPVQRVQPDGRCVLRVASCGAAGLALSTLKHQVYTLALQPGAAGGWAPPEAVFEAPPPGDDAARIWPDLGFSAGSGTLFAACMAGWIDVFFPAAGRR